MEPSYSTTVALVIAVFAIADLIETGRAELIEPFAPARVLAGGNG